jgi:threonine dehydrogenase-like Zn-dependent dehydrogenase
MIDPFCTALHPVMRNYPDDEDTVLVLGAGVVGICTVAALRMLGSRTRIIVLAKYPFQGEMARKYGADKIIHLQDGDYFQTLADANRGKLFDPVFIKKKVLVGGVDIVYDCVGSARSIDDSLRLARSNGTVVLVGLASIPKKVDWTPIWLNELSVKGSNWCSTEIYNDQRVRTFQIAIDWMAEGLLDLAQLVTHRFELEDYKHALSTTAKRGRNQVIKSVFSFE